MKILNFKALFVLALLALFIQACAEDELETEIIQDEDEQVSDQETDNDDDDDQQGTTNRQRDRITLSDANSMLVVDWTDVLLELDRYATGMRPNATSRALAYIHLATYETAVADMAGYTSNVNRLNGFNINPDQRADNIDLGLALNACYARALDYFIYNVPGSINSAIEDLEDDIEDELSEGLTDEVIENSQEWGEYVANRVIAYSRSDQEAEEQIDDPQPDSYEPPVGEGFWTYSADAERAWFPYWSSVRTFVISSDATSSVAPEDEYSENTNSDYYAQMLEVYETNNTSREENGEELWIAEFWSDDVEGLMMSPPGRQISIASQLIEDFDLDIEESLAMLLKVGFALNDAAVSCWADKYNYMVMRPSVYIQEFIDPDFQTNLYKFIFWPNPSFPGYPSGHSTFASAAGGVFIDIFGDSVDFTDRTHAGRTEFLGTPRQFSSISDMAEENAFSRIPLGVHIRMDCTEGLRLGYEIADAINDFDLTSGNDL